jgi:hypothetical protein
MLKFASQCKCQSSLLTLLAGSEGLRLCLENCALNIRAPFIIPLREGYGATGGMDRGDQQEDMFRNGAERERFLSTLREACGKTEWQVLAYFIR